MIRQDAEMPTARFCTLLGIPRRSYCPRRVEPAQGAYRQIFNHVRPHEALGLHRPIKVHHDPTLKPTKIEKTQP